jgi:hypothetical protein
VDCEKQGVLGKLTLGTKSLRGAPETSNRRCGGE